MAESDVTLSLKKSYSLVFDRAMGTESHDRRTDECSLVRGMIAGDESAFDEFADAYIPALHRFASSRLRQHRELVHEIVQGTLVKALAKLAFFRGESSLMTWLCACCKREIAAHFRRDGRRLEVEWTDDAATAATPPGRTPPDGPEQSVLRDETARLVHTALDLLAPRHSQVLEWKYLDRLPVREIADRMNLGVKAAESLLTRARISFRETYTRLQSGVEP